MKAFKSSELTTNRAAVMKEARTNGCILQELRTNGEVISEAVMMNKSELDDLRELINDINFSLSIKEGLHLIDYAAPREHVLLKYISGDEFYDKG